MTAFERDPRDELVEEWPLKIDSAAIAEILGVPEERAVAGDHQVRPEHVDKLAPYVSDPIDLDFVGATVESTA